MGKGIFKKDNKLYLNYDIVTHDSNYKLTHRSGPVIQEPNELRAYLSSFDIVGSIIKDISYITDLKDEPLVYNHGIISLVMVESPLVIITDKGAFEIDYSESSTVIFTKDQIQPKYYSNASNVFKNYFSSLKGLTIEDVTVDEQDFNSADETFTGSYGLWLDDNQPSYIKALHFKLSNGKILQFTNDYDNGEISLITAEGKHVKILTDNNIHD